MESAVGSAIQTLAATLSRQRGIQYEFGPEYAEYTASKAAGDEGKSHLKPLSEIFTPEQLDEIEIDNKVGENYFGEMTVQCEKRVHVLSRQLESNWSSAPIETWHFKRVLKKCWPTRN